MSLPWFPFNIKAYVTDTMALTTEGHGAYLLLMLHYYATERPPRDNDRSLAAIAKLPLERWLEHRPEIEPFFTVTDGVWNHQRIDDELRNGLRRHEQTVAATAAAKAAREAKRLAKLASDTTPPAKRPSPPRDVVRNGLRDVVREQSVTSTQEQEQEQDTIKDSPLASLAGSAPEEIGLGDTIPENWTLSPADRIVAEGFGMSPQTMDDEARYFHASKLQSCAMSPNWSRSWVNWCQGWVERQPKPKRKPKLIPMPADWKPSDKHRAMAIEHGEDIREVEAIFREHIGSKAVQYADYDLAFAGFIRRQKNFRRGNINGSPAASNPRAGSLVGSIHREIAELEAEQEAADPALSGRVVRLLSNGSV